MVDQFSETARWVILRVTHCKVWEIKYWCYWKALISPATFHINGNCPLCLNNRKKTQIQQKEFILPPLLRFNLHKELSVSVWHLLCNTSAALSKDNGNCISATLGLVCIVHTSMHCTNPVSLMCSCITSLEGLWMGENDFFYARILLL